MDDRHGQLYAHVDQPAFEQMQIDQNISRIAIFFVCFITIGVFYFTLINFPIARLFPVQQLEQMGQVVSALNPAASRVPVATNRPTGALGGSQISTSPSASPAASAAPVSSPASVLAAPASNAATAISARPAAAVAPPSSAPPASGNTYQVQSGDTLSSIARKYNTTVQALADANKISNSASLQVGQRLVIPKS